MKKFDKAFEILMENEGRVITNEDYDGQITNHGLTQKFLDDAGYKMDVKLMSLELIKEVFRNEFWLKLKCERITSCTISYSLFDFGVNVGRSRAVKCLQQAVNKSKEGFELVTDGIIGRRTISALNQVENIQNLSVLFAKEKIKLYNEINSKKYADRMENLEDGIMTTREVEEYIKKRQNFMEGWTNRSFKMIGRV